MSPLSLEDSARVTLVSGGSERALSVKNGIDSLRSAVPDYVLIHDAARPGLTHSVINDLLTALETHQGAAPALPVADSLKRETDGQIASIARENLYRIQTPQAFRYSDICNLYEADISAATDDFTLAEKSGLSLKLVQGTELLGKITYPQDLVFMEKMMAPDLPRYKTGLGYDVHAFEDGNAVTLCGIEIPHTAKLKGHSDADVAWHALTDAILGALAEGDIGDHFPPSDPQWKGVPSSVFLEFAVRRVRERKGEIINVDMTIICEAPKIKPHRDAMRARTSEILDIPLEDVAVKATTTEQLGFTGRREGIAAQAICSIRLPAHSTDTGNSARLKS